VRPPVPSPAADQHPEQVVEAPEAVTPTARRPGEGRQPVPQQQALRRLIAAPPAGRPYQGEDAPGEIKRSRRLADRVTSGHRFGIAVPHGAASQQRRPG
jgi:hypothetical protein